MHQQTKAPAIGPSPYQLFMLALCVWALLLLAVIALAVWASSYGSGDRMPATPTPIPPPSNPGLACGVERWFVKTLADPDASAVNPAVATAVSIRDLNALPAPCDGGPDRRAYPEEFRVFEVSGPRHPHRARRRPGLSHRVGRSRCVRLDGRNGVGGYHVRWRSHVATSADAAQR